MAAPLILGLWSVVLQPGQTLSQNTSPAIQITNISYGAEVKGSARSAVIMKYPEFEQESDDEDEDDEEDEEDDGEIKLPNLITKETVLAVLKPNGTEQASVNVALVEDVEVVELSVTGENPVHLIGHYIRQEDFDQPPSDDEEDYGSEFDESGDYDSDELEGLIDGESEDDDMTDGEGRIEEIQEKPSKKRAAIEDAPAGADDSTVSAASLAGLSKNQKKKLAKKQKGEDGEAVAPAAAAASPAAKKEAPAAAKKEEKPAAKKEEKKAGPKTQVIAGGLEITDAKVGTGAAAKSGSKVGMRYIGKLENGKVFDSNTKGAPLTFTLGRGQVIKGWDLGVAGMQVGGERKLKIPAKLAYGNQKIAGIPAGSTLLFDVKLVSLK
ncbi:Peptidylprolyl isomerase [Rhodotorula diobovata]|uniref:FK506-binding protein n=1 Tax=Rhodotorula diobovata TaxID=5288 RepID=A0A5C5FSM0_9BASI|nr:Peptidylprolyl isomerase [Rhodotorula diobovata]